MQGFDHFAVGIEPRQQPVGARRRPGLLDAERLDGAELHRLEAIAAGGERGRDPEVRRDGPHHLVAEIVLAQHEFDQMRAHGEETEPEAAVARCEPSRAG